MKHLYIDGANFAHRARAGFQEGQHAFMFNFFRNLRALVGLHNPDRTFYVLEGRPVKRLEQFTEYKATRAIAEDDPLREHKVAERDAFWTAYDECLQLLRDAFPVTILKHPFLECDDVIHHIAATEDYDEAVIVSSDTDFIQTVQTYGAKGLRLYNATKKVWVEAPTHDYVLWKALKGDASDNIPGVPGIGDKRAAQLLLPENASKLNSFLNDPEKSQIVERNVNLIKLHVLTNEVSEGIQIHFGEADWDHVKSVFEDRNFTSILKEKSWEKFIKTFAS